MFATGGLGGKSLGGGPEEPLLLAPSEKSLSVDAEAGISLTPRDPMGGDFSGAEGAFFPENPMQEDN